MDLRALTQDDCEQIRTWRNECLENLRTPFLLTKEMQESFYKNTICDRNSPHRYWAIISNSFEDYPAGDVIKIKDLQKPECPSKFIGMGGITNIQWENSIGEISLIIDPELRNKGYGKKAVDLILNAGFNQLNLQTICGEVYGCNHFNVVEFWKKITEKYTKTNFVNWLVMRNRKFWNGKFYPGYYFTIDRDEYNETSRTNSPL